MKKAREGGIVVGVTVPSADELELPAERDLAASVATLVAADSHGETLRQVAALQPAVSKFFDDVMVMVDNTALRDARLALLASIEGRLVDVADFTRLL